MFKKFTRKASKGFSFAGLFVIAAVLATACTGQPPANQTMTVAALTQAVPNTGGTQPAATVPAGTPPSSTTQPGSGGSKATPVPGSSGGDISTVEVTEGNFYIKLSHNVVPPGKVTFDVTNQGPDAHEFVIFKTQLSQDNLPTQNGQINENASSVNKVEDHSQVPKGTSYTVTANLQPGHYVVVCNLPGHYLQGMHAELVVSQNAAATLTAQPPSSGGQGVASGGQSATPTPGGTQSAPSTTVGVILKEYEIYLNALSVQPGTIAFNVQNQGIGQDQLVIVKTSMSPDQLPLLNGTVDTSASGVNKIAQSQTIQPGKSTTFTAKLDPGSYVLYSGQEAHYNQGERIAFNVGSSGVPATGGQAQQATPTPTQAATQAPTQAASAASVAATAATPEVTPTVGPNATQVKVIEEDYSIFMNDVVLPAGQVQFQVRNIANMQHEFVVFQTDLKAGNLPVQNGQVVETAPQLNKMGEQDQFPGGQSRTLTLTLQPGHYVAICNIVGHYQQGMHIDFWVVGSQSALPSIPSTESSPAPSG